MSELLGDFPRLFPKPAHTIAGIGIRLREGRTTCVEILQACLDQVKEWEPKVHAWVKLDQDRAMEQAHALDKELKSGGDRGPLHGIPIGIKDIIDVAGLPTACGARRWAARVADSDADVVERLRNAGAVIMGKTVTTPYAWIDPPLTRNPWNLDRSPGGSSSGSAAAVACGMCLGAIGTQTGGSITRPASFCGVAGMKPSRILTRTIGVFPFAPALTTWGRSRQQSPTSGACSPPFAHRPLSSKACIPPARAHLDWDGYAVSSTAAPMRPLDRLSMTPWGRSRIAELRSSIWMIRLISSRYSRTIDA